jgi:hypothetical protein
MRAARRPRGAPRRPHYSAASLMGATRLEVDATRVSGELQHPLLGVHPCWRRRRREPGDTYNLKLKFKNPKLKFQTQKIPTKKSKIKNQPCSRYRLVEPVLSEAADTYVIDAASNDETFIINGEVFKAQTYCMGWEKQDQVIFMDGSPLGVCVTAELYNLNRKKQCRVWCE